VFIFSYLPAPSPRYAIPPYLRAKDLRRGSYLFHTSSIPMHTLSQGIANSQ
jgi:hypothetical protein